MYCVEFGYQEDPFVRFDTKWRLWCIYSPNGVSDDDALGTIHYAVVDSRLLTLFLKGRSGYSLLGL